MVANTLEIVNELPVKRFLVELVPIPTIPKNVKYFQDFEDDRHNLSFLANSSDFEDQIIDEDNREEVCNKEDNEDIMKLTSNVIPKGMVTLECLLDSNPRVKEKITMKSKAGKYEPHNIGLEGQDQIVFIGKVCSNIEKEEILKILKEYIDVIARGYEDLKTFDTSIITHTIPLKPDIKSF